MAGLLTVHRCWGTSWRRRTAQRKETREAAEPVAGSHFLFSIEVVQFLSLYSQRVGMLRKSREKAPVSTVKAKVLTFKALLSFLKIGFLNKQFF
jgi:hypothetical protein